MENVPEDTLQMSIDFIVKSAEIPKRDVDRAQLKACVAEIEKNAESGLHFSQLETLAYKVVFNNSYDITVRRKVLYCMVPVDEEFPYHIIPLAVSDATAVPVNPTWQYSILSWLGGLLEYCVIDNSNKFVHICYTAIINLASNLNVVLLVCKILSHLTTRYDVTPQRTNFLIRLKEKAGFFEKVSQLLRLYQLFRPDLVVGKLSSRHLVQSAPRNLKISLLALRDRLQENQDREFVSSRVGIWGEINRAEKSNPYQRPTAIPQPDNNYYTETIEEKTNKIIFVSQYKSFSEITKGIPNSNHWKWPNNPASHLTRPEIIPLFRPHDQTVLVGLTNWLEIALRTELVDGIGNPGKQRCEKLLKSVYSLVKVTNAHIPVVNHFLAEYMTIWDQNSHFEIVLSLLECVTYSSPDFVSITLLKLLGELLDHAALYKWCRIMETISNTAASWAVRAHEESHRTEDFFHWPCGLEENLDGAIMGLWFLTYRLEHFFLVALVEFKCHPMVVHQILDYYVKINMIIEELELSAVFAPPVLITAAVITHSDLATVHRLGKHLSSLPAAFEKLRNKNASGVEKDVQTECLSMGESVNQSVSLFFTAVCSASAFGKAFRRALDPFFSFDHLQKMLGAKSVKKYASVIHALPYIPFFAKRNVDKRTNSLDSEEREEMIKHVIAELKDHGFSGINECQNAYKVK